jgi:ElaB/YqjD/DUF883 family membrane-anchored ribosome-binding protein
MARTTDTPTDAAEDFEAIRKDLDTLRTDVAALSRHLKGLGEGKLEQLRAVGGDKIDVLRAELEQTVDQLRRHGQESVASVERTIQDKPLMSLLAAFGAGMLIARLLERR